MCISYLNVWLVLRDFEIVSHQHASCPTGIHPFRLWDVPERFRKQEIHQFSPKSQRRMLSQEESLMHESFACVLRVLSFEMKKDVA
jgi:hypothetical protein